MIKFAVVTSVSPFKVRFDSDVKESGNTNYLILSTYTPAKSDRVVFIDDGKNKICFGKVQ